MRNSSSDPKSFDALVVGAGIIGSAIAWRAARDGLSIALIDERPGRGASWAAAGMLAPVTEVHYEEEQLLRLNISSARAYPEFVAELQEASGMPVGFTRCGTLLVARDSDENAELEELHGYQQRLGLQVERLRARECRDLEPSLAPSIRGGILAPDDHQVDNRALMEALHVACDRAGVVRIQARVAEALSPSGSVTGVRLEDGTEIASPAVVVAAGCRSGLVRSGAQTSIAAVRPVKGQLIHLRLPEGSSLARRTIRGLDAYMVSRPDGRIVVGATVEEQGFDERVTAGALYELLRSAQELLPGLSEAEVVETVAGLRPGTPDNRPLIGDGDLEGLIVATGHYRNGILLAPATADAVAYRLTNGRMPAGFEAFSPRRFVSERVA